MLNPDHRRYFIPESGLALERCEAYRTEHNRILGILHAYTQSLGGTHYRLNDVGAIRDIRFLNEPPKGFKPSKKTHDNMPGKLYRPRFGSQVEKDMAALPKVPSVFEYLNFTKMLTEVDYKPAPDAPECKAPIGNPNNPLCFIDWYDSTSPLLVVLPDQAITCAALKRKYPEVVFLHGEDKHDPVIDGMKEILLKEYELMEERHRRGLPV